MKINIGKLLGDAARYAKANPTKVLAAAVILGGPVGRVAAKAAPLILAATAKEPT